MQVMPAKAPPGTYWRGPVLWGRVEVRGREHRFSLQTADPSEAVIRREDEKRRLIDSAYFGKAGLTDAHAQTTWRRGRARKTPGFIYFVEADGHIKIGFAKNWRSRITTLQIANHRRLKVVGVIAGSQEQERGLHQRFAHLRSRGEWFQKGEELANYIEKAKVIGRYVGEDAG